MSGRLALIVCPKKEADDFAGRKLLGLTIGERLLLSIEKAGVTRVLFMGDGPRPTCDRSKIEIVEVDSIGGLDEEAIVLPADLILDVGVLTNHQPIPSKLPLEVLPRAEFLEVVKDSVSWLDGLDKGVAGEAKGFAIRVNDEESTRLASKSLIKSLYKSTDGIISRNLNRKISTSITRVLVKFPIKPNLVTAVVFLVGAASFPLAYMGTHLGIALAGFCYWFSAVLDGCDGEISRLKYMGSPLGAWLDTIVDDLAGLFFIAGMYLALDANADHQYWYWIGIGGVGFYLATILPRYYIMATRSGSGDYQKMAGEIRPENRSAIARFGLAVRDIVFRTDFLPFYAMVTAAIGYVEAFALPFAIGAVASAVDTFITVVSYKPESE